MQRYDAVTMHVGGHQKRRRYVRSKREDGYVALLVAVIEQARRDAFGTHCCGNRISTKVRAQAQAWLAQLMGKEVA